MDCGNARTPSIHHRLGSATVAADFPWGKQPEFPMGEIPLGQLSCKPPPPKKTTTTSLFQAWQWISLLPWLAVGEGQRHCGLLQLPSGFPCSPGAGLQHIYQPERFNAGRNPGVCPVLAFRPHGLGGTLHGGH